jgi:hypothetical protein
MDIIKLTNMKISIIYNILFIYSFNQICLSIFGLLPQKTNIACFKHNRVETNCSKVGVIGNAVTGFQLIIKQWKFMAAQAFRRPSPDGNYEGFKECACESDISDSD